MEAKKEREKAKRGKKKKFFTPTTIFESKSIRPLLGGLMLDKSTKGH